MAQFNPSYQGSLDGFSYGGGGSTEPTNPLTEGNPSTSGFNGASLVQTNGNPQGGVYGQPGSFGNPAAPPSSGGSPGGGMQNQNSFGNPGWKPSYSAPGGYNPLQYADNNTANSLAQGLGGSVYRTVTPGPFGDFGQNLIDFGNGNQLNAGLLGDRYSKYDRATADAMTAAERNAKPVVTNPNAGAVFMTGDPTKNSYVHPTPPPVAPVVPPPQNPLIGGPGTEPTQQSTSQTGPMPGVPQGNQLMALLQLLGLGGQQRQQYRQPYANSGYYPNLPRFNQGLGTPATQTTPAITTQQLLSLLLGF